MRYLPLWLLTTCAAAAATELWLPPSNSNVQIEQQGATTWIVRSSTTGEFTLESSQRYDAKPGDAFKVNLPIRVDFHTRALPDLVCYDAAGKEIPSPAPHGPSWGTSWQTVRRVIPIRPGMATVFARDALPIDNAKVGAKHKSGPLTQLL